MIAPIRTSSDDHRSELAQDQFLTMLPLIRRLAWSAFRGMGAEARDDLIQEVIANAYRTWVRLVRQGKEALAYPTPLAQFAIRQVRDGRRVGGRQKVNDVMSLHACRTRGFTIARLDQQDESTGSWNQLLVEDRQAGPAETAAARIDVAAWFYTLSKRHRKIAKALAVGESTGVVARQFGLSPGRVSQLRGWFQQHWERFQEGGQSAEVVAQRLGADRDFSIQPAPGVPFAKTTKPN